MDVKLYHFFSKLDNGVESGKTPTSSGSSFPSTSSSSSKPDGPLKKAKRSHLPVSNCEMVHLSGRKAQSIKVMQCFASFSQSFYYNICYKVLTVIHTWSAKRFVFV